MQTRNERLDSLISLVFYFAGGKEIDLLDIFNQYEQRDYFIDVSLI